MYHKSWKIQITLLCVTYLLSYGRGIKCKRYIKQILGKKELELREKELELIWGWAKELE